MVVTFVVLGLAEVALRIGRVGEDAPRHDPFAGFSNTTPTFEKTLDADGGAIRRVARNRANPRRSEAVLADPQRRFLADKPANGYRVFVVGGSSSAGVPYPSTRQAFSGWLEGLLEQALPQRSVEVVNAAFSGYATRRVLTVVREIARYEPDLVIIYSGHNEFAEQRFYAHLIDLDPLLFRLWQLAASLRIYQLTSGLLPVPAREAPSLDFEEDSRRSGQMFQVLQQRAQGEGYASERERAYGNLHYAFNLRQMVSAIQTGGGQVALLSLGQNLSDWAPAASSHAEDVSVDERERFAARVADGDAARTAGDCDEAVAAYQLALSIDVSFAQTHFDLAGCLRTLGRHQEAAAHYRAASDLDRVPHGAPSAFNDVLREVAVETGALFIDVEEGLRVASEDGLVGDDLFLDMLHPNLRGHQTIARTIFDALGDAGLRDASGRWDDARTSPSPDELYREDPHLRFLDQQIRLVACQLARRFACVSDAAAAMRALEPDNPITTQLTQTR